MPFTFCVRQHSINKWCRHVKEFDHRTAISIGEKVYVYKRPNSGLWQCASYFAGKNRRTSAKEESLSPRPRKSPRTGTYSFGENSAQARSRAKFGETSNGNPEPNPERHQPGRCRD